MYHQGTVFISDDICEQSLTFSSDPHFVSFGIFDGHLLIDLSSKEEELVHGTVRCVLDSQSGSVIYLAQVRYHINEIVVFLLLFCLIVTL